MALQDDLDEALEELLEFTGNEDVTIYADGGATYNGPAIVTGGAMHFDAVTGGTYEKDAYTMRVRKSDLDGFVPLPGMLVDGRDKILRIPQTPNSVTVGRADYRIEVCGRDVPA
jgi:hypothetical protein